MTVGDKAAPQSKLRIAPRTTTLWALLWIGAPVRNLSVGVKCEAPLWAVRAQRGVFMWTSAVDFQCAAPLEAPVRGSHWRSSVGLQCGAPVCDSNVGLGL